MADGPAGSGDGTGTDDPASDAPVDDADPDADPASGRGANDDLAATFDALADERRLRILRVLYDAQLSATEPEDLRLTFSDLYDRVDVDGTSTFSYHLDRLVGTYVAKTDGGYALTATGRRIVRTVRAGTYADLPTFEEVTLETACPRCECSPVEAVCENGVLAVVCPDCSLPFIRDQVQPALLVGRSPGVVLESYDRQLRRNLGLELDGVCSACSGEVSLDLRPSSEQVALEWLAVTDCRQCGKRNQFPPYFALLYHPLVVSFYWRRGLDLTDVRTWRAVEFVLDGEWTPEVVGEDPFRCRVNVERDGDELSITLDGDLRASDATLHQRRDPLPGDGPDR